MDTYLGAREKTLVLFASGILQRKQHNPQETRYSSELVVPRAFCISYVSIISYILSADIPCGCRTRLATGLKITHKQLGNHQLVSQYLTVLGSLAIAMHDTTQARDILKSSFTLAKSLHDIPTQVTVLSELKGIALTSQLQLVDISCNYSLFRNGVIAADFLDKFYGS